jgi:histone H2A
MEEHKNVINKVVKKKKSHMFETYISKVLKQISASNGITNNAKQQLNSILCHIIKHISMLTVKLTMAGKKKTISLKEVENSLTLALSGKLLENSFKEGRKSCDNISNNEKNINSSRQNKAGIIFPPSLVEKFLRDFGSSNVMIGSLSPIFLASVLEYICFEILDLSVNYCKENKHVRITIRDLELSVRNDIELNHLFVKLNMSFLGGGVLPYIHASLLNKTKTKIKKKKTTGEDNNNENTHRFRYGTLAIKNIKKQQKLSNCLILSKSPFEKLVRNIFKQNNTIEEESSQKFSKDVFTVLQYFMEQYIVEILRNSNFLAIHAGRVKLIPYDILLYNSFINGGRENPYTKSSVNLFSLENQSNLNLIFDGNQDEEEKIDEALFIDEDYDEENEILT